MVTFTNNRNITYIYDATGVKLKKVITQSSTSTNTEYADGIIYENGVLEMIPQPEGYIQPGVTGGYDYVYQYKDHLGNIRLSYSDSDGNGSVDSSEILSEKHYYPFGMTQKGYNNVVQNSNSAASKFKYNGKELNDELGLDWYDYGARNYDASLGRWMNIDPLAEQFYDTSPYTYVSNNPLRYTDPTGMAQEDIIIIDTEGTVTDVIEDDGPNVVYEFDKNTNEINEVEDLGNALDANGIKKDDKIVDGDLFRLVTDVEIFRIEENMDLDKSGDREYGHYWVETHGNKESYGWWPKYRVGGLMDTVLGVEGELNGQTSFGGTTTTDAHHGDRYSGITKHSLYTTGGLSTSGISDKIKNYANSYSGQWSYPIGQNCQSFQKDFMKKLNLVIDP